MVTTVKLVVIGAAGVGKTSLRGQYISGRFSTGYRATIGADFITKVLPHPTKEDETVTLQIWDTAGQERFSSLSSAFFRGADAVLLMFDVNSPETMEALSRWWEEFKKHAPVNEDEIGEYCCVVVGNKIDLAGDGLEGGSRGEGSGKGDALEGERGQNGGKSGEVVLKDEAERFLRVLVPVECLPDREEDSLEAPLVAAVAASSDGGVSEEEDDDDDEDPLAASQLTIRPNSPSHPLDPTSSSLDARIHTPTRKQRSNSITIIPHPLSSRPHSPLSRLRPRNSPRSSSSSISPPPSRRRLSLSKSRSRSTGASSRFYAGAGGTVTTMHSGLSVYHTPSSSLFDQYESARSSPEMWDSNYGSYPPTSGSASYSPGVSGRGRSLRMPGGRRLTVLSNGSSESTGSESASTVTPSVYARERHDEQGNERDLGRSHGYGFLHDGTVASSAVSFVSALSGRSSFTSHAPTSTTSSATTPENDSVHVKSAAPISPPDYGPKLFYTSAKTGEGVKDVFEYIARRVVGKWEWEERREAGRLEMREGGEGSGTIGIGWRSGSNARPRRNGKDSVVQLWKEPHTARSIKWGECCAS